MKQGYSLYDQTVEVTTDYLGPAAKRFIDRQITAHLGKQPEKLTARDLGKLTAWMEAVVSLLTKDEKTVSEYVGKLNKLAGSQGKNK